jgi:hypothetical protein
MAGVDVVLVLAILLHPSGHGMTDDFHLLGNLGLILHLLELANGLEAVFLKGIEIALCRVSQARRKKKRARTDCPGPLLSSLVRYWCGAKRSAEFLMVTEAVPR